MNEDDDDLDIDDADSGAGTDAGNAPPCWLALMVCSMALMTAYASPEPTASVDAAVQKSLLARKIVGNLFFLRDHPHAPPRLRQVAGNMHALWIALAKQAAASMPSAPSASAGQEVAAAAVSMERSAWLH